MHGRTETTRYLIGLLLPLLLLAGACSGGKPSASNVVATTAPSAASSGASQLKGSVSIDFSGAPKSHEAVSKTYAVAPGTKALDAVKAALGADSLTTKDFGGNLGVFVTGLYGIEAEGNHFWEFTVNGKSADVGISTYEVKEGDALGFRYSSY